MRKTIILIIVLVATFSISSYAQTLKITAVDASDPKVYEKLSQGLGKTITLSFYDNSITLNTQGEKPLNLKKVSDSKYYKSVTTGTTVETYSLTVNKVFGVVSSIELNFTGKKRDVSNWATLTAKRL